MREQANIYKSSCMIFNQRQQSRAQQQHNPAQLQTKKTQEKSDIYLQKLSMN